MSGKGDERVSAGVLAALRKGPLDVLDLLKALRRVAGTAIQNQEGHLHALLHSLLRRQQLMLDGRSSRGLLRYAVATEDGPASEPTPATPDDDPHAPGNPGWANTAAKIARGVRDPAQRGRVVADVLAHLEQLEAAGSAEAFGSVRAARHYVRRADRGRPTVFFTASAGDGFRRFLVHEGPWLLAAVVVFLVVRAFLAEVFVIPSPSMVPTLLPGDRVVVWKPGGKSRPARWRIYTFEKDDITYVKRVAGRGGETLRIMGGDLYVNGQLDQKSDEIRRALRFPYAGWLFPADGKAWRTFAGPDEGKEWVYAGPPMKSVGPVPPSPAPVDVSLRDVYAELEIDRAAGETVDLILDYLEPEHLGNRDVPAGFHLAVGDGGWTFGVHRGDAGGGSRLDWPVPQGRISLRLSYVDGVVRAASAGHTLRREVEVPRGLVVRPRFHTSGPASRPVRLGLDKDIHYSPAGDFAVGPHDSDDPDGFRVPTGCVFFLGDNTYNSRDSRFRTMGVVPEADLIGPVHIRIWPPGRVGGVR